MILKSQIINPIFLKHTFLEIILAAIAVPVKTGTSQADPNKEQNFRISQSPHRKREKS